MHGYIVVYCPKNVASIDPNNPMDTFAVVSAVSDWLLENGFVYSSTGQYFVPSIGVCDYFKIGGSYYMLILSLYITSDSKRIERIEKLESVYRSYLVDTSDPKKLRKYIYLENLFKEVTSTFGVRVVDDILLDHFWERMMIDFVDLENVHGSVILDGMAQITGTLARHAFEHIIGEGYFVVVEYHT